MASHSLSQLIFIARLSDCGRFDVVNKNVDYFHKCGNHFETSMFLNSQKNRLLPFAKPTLLLPENVSHETCVVSTPGPSCSNTILPILDVLQVSTAEDELTRIDINNGALTSPAGTQTIQACIQILQGKKLRRTIFKLKREKQAI
ncbi:hypothetical protein FQR65_LT11946 [Abscondita terminalis]|nr:hypothetical protein FQR65_LT11946 [Abscondita terminalis]